MKKSLIVVLSTFMLSSCITILPPGETLSSSNEVSNTSITSSIVSSSSILGTSEITSSSITSSSSSSSSSSQSSSSSSSSQTSSSSQPSSEEPVQPKTDFNGLKADLSGAASLGIMKRGSIPEYQTQQLRNGIKRSSSDSSSESDITTDIENPEEEVIVKIDEDETIEEVPFIDEETQEEVALDVFPYWIEVKGNFTYMIFYQTQEDLNLLQKAESYDSKIYHEVTAVSSASHDFFHNMIRTIHIVGGISFHTPPSINTSISFMIMDNSSGKIINFIDLYKDVYEDLGIAFGDDMFYNRDAMLVRLERYEDVIYFAFVGKTGTAITKITFDSDSLVFDVTTLKTTVRFFPISITKSGLTLFKINFNGNYNLLKEDWTTVIEDFPLLNGYVPEIPQNKPIYIKYGESEFIYFIFERFWVKLDKDFNYIHHELFNMDYSDTSYNHETFYASMYLGENEESIYTYNMRGYIQKYNLSNLSIEKITSVPVTIFYSIPTLVTKFSYDGKIFYMKEKLLVFDLETETTTAISSNVYSNPYSENNPISKDVLTGYISYSITSGISKLDKYLNLKTLEIYNLGESLPSIDIRQVQPLN